MRSGREVRAFLVLGSRRMARMSGSYPGGAVTTGADLLAGWDEGPGAEGFQSSSENGQQGHGPKKEARQLEGALAYSSILASQIRMAAVRTSGPTPRFSSLARIAAFAH